MINFNFRFYWSLFLRRLPVMMALLLVCSALGVITALNLPPTYSTSARLLVEAPQIPDNMAASTVRTDAAEQLQVIEQQLLTRANMIDIANRFQVFGNMSQMSPDEVFAQMMVNTRIRRTGGRDQATLMTLSFNARSGQIAANVVNEYVTLILQTANAFRISRVENTLEFFEQEVARLGADLDQQSARIVSFKNENATTLPDDLDFRLNRQSLLQERVGRLERDRAALVNRRAEIVRIFQSTGQLNLPRERELSPEEEQLQQLRRDMQSARAVYSETNPRIQLLQRQIERLETQLAAQAPQRQGDAPAEPEASLLEVSLAEIDTQLATLEQELVTASAELAALEASIAATSATAISLNALERDYDNIQARYNAAVNNLSTAQMGERIEVSSQGQRITVIEAANVPNDPSGPNRTKIAVTGIGAGLGAAGGFFVLLEVLNRRIRRPAELQGRFKITPIATIPYMETRGQKFMRRGILVSAFLAVLIGVPAALWYIDTYYMPLELVANKIAERLGI